MSDEEIPKDLGIEVKSQDQLFWESVIEITKQKMQFIEDQRKEMLKAERLNTEILNLAELRCQQLKTSS